MQIFTAYMYTDSQEGSEKKKAHINKEKEIFFFFFLFRKARGGISLQCN
jgi:hypothetical protein